MKIIVVLTPDEGSFEDPALWIFDIVDSTQRITEKIQELVEDIQSEEPLDEEDIESRVHVYAESNSSDIMTKLSLGLAKKLEINKEAIHVQIMTAANLARRSAGY